MNFEWTEEQEMLRESVRRFVEENAAIDFARAQWDDPAGVTPAVWSGLADLGATILANYSPRYGWGDGRANLVSMMAALALFSGAAGVASASVVAGLVSSPLAPPAE